MSRTTRTLTPELREYMLSVSSRETSTLRLLREETSVLRNSNMQTTQEQGQLLNFIAKITGAKRALEVGVFTGYSSLWTAMALPEDGELVACDISREYTDIARKYWEASGIGDRITLVLGPAERTLAEFIDNGESDSFDLAYIDADKESYGTYYRLWLQLLRRGGVMALDNVFRGGRVADPRINDEGTNAMRELNRRIHMDDRVDMTMIPIGDGLTVLRKR